MNKQILKQILRKEGNIMRQRVNDLTRTMELLNAFHLVWAELNRTKQRARRNKYSLLAIGDTVVFHAAGDAKSVFQFPDNFKK